MLRLKLTKDGGNFIYGILAKTKVLSGMLTNFQSKYVHKFKNVQWRMNTHVDTELQDWSAVGQKDIQREL